MKRGVISFTIIGLPILLFVFALATPAAAKSLAQTVPQPTTPERSPVAVSVRQQLPFTITLRPGETVTAAAELTETIAITFDLSFDFTLAEPNTTTITATVPSTVSFRIGDRPTSTMLVSLTVAMSPTALIQVAPVPTPTLTTTAQLTGTIAPTATGSTTETAPLTPTLGITTTVPPQLLNPTIISTVVITANLRGGPDTISAIETTLPAGRSVLVVAQNDDGSWYLLNNGLWLAAFLIENPPTDLPLATDELVTTLRARNPVTPTVPILTPPTVTETVTETVPLTATTAPTTTESTATEPVTAERSAQDGRPILVPTPTPAATTPEVTVPTAAVNANLREGPDTTFAISGGTVAGEALTVVGRNEDASWFLLDNGGWISAPLVANAPDPADVPLETAPAFPADDPISAEESVTSTLSLTATLAPTATPAATTTATTTTTATPIFGVQENIYLIRVDGITDRYDFTLARIEALVSAAQQDQSLLEDQEWIVQMTTMTTLLRAAGEELTTLTPPPLFADAHTQLLQAVTAYNSAADQLTAGVEQAALDALLDASIPVNSGDQSLASAQAAIEALTP